MSKKILLFNFLNITIFALLTGISGCKNQATNTAFTQTTRVNQNLPKVVATTSVICDLTKQIAENTINLTCLISPGVDPHLYQTKPEDSKALAEAQLILYSGYNLEPDLVKAIKATQTSAPKIAVAQLAVPKPQQFIVNGTKVSDPHIWHDVKNTIKMVSVISDSLEKLDPKNQTNYISKTKQITNELNQLDRWIKSRILSIPKKHRKLVTTHNAFAYYAQAYGLSLAGTLQGLNTERKPTATRVKSLIKGIQQEKVPIIFAETTINPNLIQSVAKDAEVKISQRQLYADDIGEPGSEAESYQKMMVANTRTIVEGLGGTYLIFEPKP